MGVIDLQLHAINYVFKCCRYEAIVKKWNSDWYTVEMKATNIYDLRNLKSLTTFNAIEMRGKNGAFKSSWYVVTAERNNSTFKMKEVNDFDNLAEGRWATILCQICQNCRRYVQIQPLFQVTSNDERTKARNWRQPNTVHPRWNGVRNSRNFVISGWIHIHKRILVLTRNFNITN